MQHLNNRVRPLSIEGAHSMDAYCCLLEMDYQDKVEQIGSEAVEEGKGDRVKNIKVIRFLLAKFRANVDEHRRKSPGPSSII